MNQAIHSVDLLTWLMGPVVEIQANTATLAHERIEVEDVAVATLRFANGALGVLEATTAAYPGYLKRIEIHGSEGSAVLEEEDLKAWDFAKPRKEDKAILDEMKQHKSTGGGASDPAAIGHHGHTMQFRDFVEAVQEEPPAGDRRPRRAAIGRDHSRRLQGGGDGEDGEAAAEVGPGAEGADDGEEEVALS